MSEPVRSVDGRYARRRQRFLILSQLLYFGLPWLSWNGRPLLGFDLIHTRLNFFAWVLWPQDGILLLALFCAAVLGVHLAASLAERAFCGYACPHTMYGELFMVIERRIEGSAHARRQRSATAAWGRRLGKHLTWLLLSAAIGWTLVAYAVPARELITRWPAGAEWGVLGAYGLLAYLNGGLLRSRFCQHLCPYGRLQGAMQDGQTLVIRYDVARGEPRAKRNRLARVRGGDCVDCSLCVQVCPAAIDIREGPQHDCIGCAACIDACDRVMDKLGLARGLIGYAYK